MTTRRAWHFVSASYTLRDGSPSILGATETHDGPMVLCQSGLHWSEHALDALKYASSPILRRVRVWGDIQTQDDKGISRNREVLWQGDVSSVLRSFARKQALSVIHLWDAPACVRNHLETGDESLRAAACAAMYDAWDVARTAACAAARDAARDAAWDAAWAAAMAAAWDAVWAAAWDTARDTARGAAKAMLEEMLITHIGAVE